MSPATRARELQAMPCDRANLSCENSSSSPKEDVGLKGLWLVLLILGFFLLDKWKKKRAANKAAEAEKKAQREQAWQDYERREQQRQQDYERREQQRWR